MLTIKERVHYVVKLSQQAMHQRTESAQTACLSRDFRDDKLPRVAEQNFPLGYFSSAGHELQKSIFLYLCYVTYELVQIITYIIADGVFLVIDDKVINSIQVQHGIGANDSRSSCCLYTTLKRQLEDCSDLKSKVFLHNLLYICTGKSLR